MCAEQKGQRPRKVNSVDERVRDESDDSDDSYCYGITYSETVNKKVNSVRGPFTEVKVNNTPITLLADSGSSVNILDETDYRKIGRPKVRKMKRGKLVPYGGQNSLKEQNRSTEGCSKLKRSRRHDKFRKEWSQH